jgi:hypothetical protein
LWGDVSALSVTSFLNISLIFSLNTSQSLLVTFEKLFLWCA